MSYLRGSHSQGNIIPTELRELRQEGVIEDAPVLDLKLEDGEIVQKLKKTIDDSEGYWRKDKNLDARRKRNWDFWRGDQLDLNRFHEFQVPYIENKILSNLETIIPIVNSKTAQPIIVEAKNTVESRQLARSLQEALIIYSERNYLRDKFRIATRHLFNDYVGILKYRWDENVGREGDVVVDWVDPNTVILDKNAALGENPTFIAEFMEATLEELAVRFPDKKERLFGRLGVKRGTRSQLNRRVGYREVWFTFYDDGEEREAVVWLYEDIVLDKMLNPHWNYDKAETVTMPNGDRVKVFKNHLDKPVKPYVFINHLNRGLTMVDDTSLVEQAIILQEVLNKRGRQIVENADAANSGLVFSSDYISKEDAAQLTGAFDERVVGTGDIRSGVGRFPPPLLPAYVFNDKIDARAAIDNIFGAHSPTRGEHSGAPTLGQDILARQGDFTRIDDIIRGVESAADTLYNGLTQMFRVFYTKDHWMRKHGKTGVTTFFRFNRDMIEDGVEVTVKSGTTLPTDKVTRRAEAIELAQLNRIDPITLYEKLDWPDPVESARRLWLWLQQPQELFGEEVRQKIDKDAMMAIQLLNNEVEPDIPSPIKEQFVDALKNFVRGSEFQQISEKAKQMHMEFLQKVVDQAKVQLGEMTPPIREGELPRQMTPTSEELGVVTGEGELGQVAEEMGQGEQVVGEGLRQAGLSPGQRGGRGAARRFTQGGRQL